MMGLKRYIPRTIAVAVAAAVIGVGFGAGIAGAAKGDLISLKKMEAKLQPLSVTLGKAEILTVPDGVSDVLIANPTVADVQAVQANKLYVVGLNIGDTNLIALDAEGNVLKRLDVHVSYDLQAIQALIDELFPHEKVRISSVHDQILLTGTVSNPETASKITNLVAHYVSDLQDEDGTIDELISNLLEVHGEQQVMLQVKIVEAERNILKELGVETALNDPNELAEFTVFGNTPLGNQVSNGNALGVAGGAGLALTQDAIGTAGALLDTGLSGIGTLGLFLEALEEEDLLNVLAEPNLTAVSGQQAGFLAGGEFPVPTGRDTFGNITIEFREFGVSLNFRPVVMSDQRINLQLNTEVSSLDTSNSVVLADVTVPGLDIRRAETTIEIPSGGSLMIAGLLQSKTTEALSGLPGIANTPVLGDLMSSDSFQREESELVVIVTAYLVEPFADDKASEEVPQKDRGELARIFKTNIRRAYGLNDDALFADAGFYGYMVD